MNSQHGTVAQRPEKSEDHSQPWTSLPCTTYVPRTCPVEGIRRIYSFFEKKRRGIRLSSIAKYKELNWLGEQRLRVAKRDGKLRPKVSFRVCLGRGKTFGKQKHVLCQRNGVLEPITVGKAAECAAEVVELCSKSEDGFDLRRPGQDLCLDELHEIGGTLQIILGYRPSRTSYDSIFSCKIKKSRSATTAPTDQAASRREPMPASQARAAVGPPPATVAAPAFAPPVTTATPASFPPQAGPSFPSYQAPHPRSAGAKPMFPAQSHPAPLPQNGPYTYPRIQYRTQMGPHPSQVPYDPYVENAGLPPPAPQNHDFACPGNYTSTEQFAAPYGGFVDHIVYSSQVPPYPYYSRY